MPEILSRAEWEFLNEVDRLGSEGVPLNEIARRHGVAPATVSYRMNSHGLTASSSTRVVDRRTGRTLGEMLAAGEIVLEDPVPAEALT
jgi:hypothetical protein